MSATGQPLVQKPMGWFIVNWLFLWPLAIYSLTSAWNNIDPAMYVGNIAEAQRQAGRVRKFGIIALCVAAVGFVLWITLFIIFSVAIASRTCYTNSAGALVCN